MSPIQKDNNKYSPLGGGGCLFVLFCFLREESHQVALLGLKRNV